MKGERGLLKIRQPIIVEGRYDKAKLSSLVEGTIISTEGFGIFRDREKLEMIRRLAQADGIIVLTDSDRAGFLIRGHIAGAVPPDRIIHVYIPEILGKEARKSKPSAQGTLGVEGIPSAILRRALEEAGVVVEQGEAPSVQPGPDPGPGITKGDLYRLGLSGGAGSGELRRQLLARLGLPGRLSANAMPQVLSRLMTLEQLEAAVQELKGRQDRASV